MPAPQKQRGCRCAACTGTRRVPRQGGGSGFANVEARQLCVKGSHNRFMASTELSAALAVPRVELVLTRPDVAECARTEPGYRLSLLRWLAAVASDDGAVSLAEYEQLCILALEGGSALEMHTVLHAIEQPQSPEEAMAGLRAAAAAFPKGARRQSLLMAAPLLRLQGEPRALRGSWLKSCMWTCLLTNWPRVKPLPHHRSCSRRCTARCAP